MQAKIKKTNQKKMELMLPRRNVGKEEKAKSRDFFSSTFAHIDEKKRSKILKAAMNEFAKNGYNGASINIIAEKAGISIGSMYSYFDSKDALYLTVMNTGYASISGIIETVGYESADIYAAVERLLAEARTYAKMQKEFVQMYLELTSECLSKLSAKLPKRIETQSVEMCAKLLAKSKEKGVVDRGVNEAAVAFCIDNLVLMYLFSFCSDYYRDRMKIFLGKNVKDGEDVVAAIVSFIRGALGAKKKS